MSCPPSPLLPAVKSAGGIRICKDYRGLKNATIKNRYPLPLIRESLDSISNTKFYTKLDVIAVFNRIRIAEGHGWMTAFTTRFGLYEMLVTPFGLCNAPATFQNYINHILYDVLDRYCTAYLDDVLLNSDNRVDHAKHVNEVICRIGGAGLQLDEAKSEFFITKTKYLRLIISTDGLSMDPEKVEAILNWKEPRNVKELQKFSGFSNFYRRFIRVYSAVIELLTRLLQKNFQWTWSEDQINTFASIKNSFIRTPTLAYFDYQKLGLRPLSTGGLLVLWWCVVVVLLWCCTRYPRLPPVPTRGTMNGCQASTLFAPSIIKKTPWLKPMPLTGPQEVH